MLYTSSPRNVNRLNLDELKFVGGITKVVKASKPNTKMAYPKVETNFQHPFGFGSRSYIDAKLQLNFLDFLL